MKTRANERRGLDPTLPQPVRSTLEKYRTSVFAEMYYLRDNGGRRYKVTNGALVMRLDENYVYCFDMESELFLAEDSPVTVAIGSNEAKGTIMACEDFQITMLLDSYIGEKVPAALIRADPWKLLEALNKRLEQISHHSNQIAISLIQDGPELCTQKSITEVSTGQGMAIEHVNANPITVVWGPPGTGKTHVMAEIAIRYITSGKSVLAVSHSNISVDGIVSKVAELMRERGMGDYLRQGRVLRFGHVRNQELAHDEDVVAHNYAMKANPKRKERLEELLSKQGRLRREGKRRTTEMARTQAEIRDIRRTVAEDERYYVERARMLATTVSRLYANAMFNNKTFDVVMFDEVSMAYVPQVICAAMYATKKLILVGDFRQLAPIAQSKASHKTLKKDVFSYLGIIDERQIAHYHPWLVMLDEQRRMHPKIAAFSSTTFYDGLLKDHSSVIHARDSIAEGKPAHSSPSVLVNLHGTRCPSARNSDNSRFNILAAVISFGSAITAWKDGLSDVGIIAPYVAQVRLIRAMLQDYGEKKSATGIACSTVHQFQGSERDVIVLDTVESYPAKKPGILTRSNDNGSVDRLVNVAATRARGKLITVANANYWGPPQVDRNNAFSKLVMHQRTFDRVILGRNGTLRTYLGNLDFGPNIKLFFGESETTTLLSDVADASEKIVISLPDGRLAKEFGTKLCRALCAAKNRGVQVLMKCLGWEDLPADWKELGWRSDDAVFPLIVIDRKVCWYGTPKPEGLAPTGTRAGTTVTTHVALRMTGYNTISIILSLTDLESRRVDHTKQSLRTREEPLAKGDDGKGSSGLAAFVEKWVKCSKCRQPMRLTQGRNGRPYLKCSKCGETGRLQKYDVNNYINIKKVRCSQCGSQLFAGANKYGLNIRCRSGHTVKADEI